MLFYKFSANMKIVWLFLVFIALTCAKRKHVRRTSKKTPHRVDLALETALVFDPKDANFDLYLIRTLRSYLDQLQYMIIKKSETRLKAGGVEKPYLIRDFLRDVGKSILEYKDHHVKSLTVALNSVIEDYYPEGTVFHKIIFDPRLKAYIKNTVYDWTEKHPKEIKNDIQTLLGDATYNNTFVNLIYCINPFYDTKEDQKKLMKLSKKFAKFPKTSTKLNKLLEDTLNFIVFDRYESLNFTQKSDLVQELSKVSDYVSKRFRDKAIDPDTTFRAKPTYENDTAPVHNVNDKAKTRGKPSKEFSESEREDIVIDPDDSLEQITRDSRQNEKDKIEFNELTKEIVFNKNVEINVRSRDPEINSTVNTNETTVAYTEIVESTKTVPTSNDRNTTTERKMVLNFWKE